jgi:uncharacterized protein YyaL (SSP411 family)
MNAVQLLTRRGGWPMSVFMTPDGRPFFGGTYWPPAATMGMPGFADILRHVAEAWASRRKELEQAADELAGAVCRIGEIETSGADEPQQVGLETQLLDQLRRQLLAHGDREHGGFGAAPKFPHPMDIRLLLRCHRRFGDEDCLALACLTLDCMADGGLYDQLGGGFHRYSTDAVWLVPHFEKMLYDNAQLAGLYVAAFDRTGQPAYRAVAEGIFSYVLSVMTDPLGPFFSAQDAETDAIEGKYYVWSAAEVDQLLGENAAMFRKQFGVVDKPDFEHGNVLFRKVPLETSILDATRTAQLAGMRKTLLAARGKRKAPLLDDKVLTSWNGLMIRSLADGGRVLKKPEYTAAAARAADFLLANLRNTSKGHLLRTHRKGKSKLHAYLVDYAFLVEGLLALHQATADEKWLTQARKLTDEQIDLYWDKTRHGFYFTSHNHEELLARTQNGFDSVIPSGNSTSVRNLVRLAKRTGATKYRTYAKQTLEAFAPQMREHLNRGGMGMSHMALALAEYLAE